MPGCHQTNANRRNNTFTLFICKPFGNLQFLQLSPMIQHLIFLPIGTQISDIIQRKTALWCQLYILGQFVRYSLRLLWHLIALMIIIEYQQNVIAKYQSLKCLGLCPALLLLNDFNVPVPHGGRPRVFLMMKNVNLAFFCLEDSWDQRVIDMIALTLIYIPSYAPFYQKHHNYQALI